MTPTLLFVIGQDRVYGCEFDSYPEVVAGQALAGTPTVTLSPIDSAVAEPTVSGETISGTEVQFAVSGMTDGAKYRGKILVATSAGKVLPALFTMEATAY